MKSALREIAAVVMPPVDPVLASLATGPLRPAMPLGRLRGDRIVTNLAELEVPEDGLPEHKLRSKRLFWW
ncbi:MAG: hypothetical protein FJZ00_00770 [Candidatus Sericytochromatia bacterium]|uniref:Uncharacterized protein n=1 Tax=Candidatus Tanganyikabacteria bacterium TaxID=2961651 RepID=A0A937X0E0_9BACT|nr:hypothetical protein [Candidatus Tanganyikabacteria bacterium]